MKSFFILFSWSAILVAVKMQSDLIYKPVVNGIKFGDFENFWDGQRIAYIQEDLVQEGNLLVLTDDMRFGSLDENGHFDEFPVSNDFRRAEFSSFVHHNQTAMIFVDESRNCLRWFNRDTSTLSKMAGKCDFLRSETKDGTFEDARFNQPIMITMGRNNTDYFFIEATTTSGGVLRHINLDKGLVASLYGIGSMRSDWKNPLGMAVVRDEYNHVTLYIACKDDIYALGLTYARFENMTSGIRGIKDGKLRESSFIASDVLVGIGTNMLLALPSSGEQLRVIDLKNEYVSSVNLSSGGMQTSAVVPSLQRIYIAGMPGMQFMTYEELQPNGEDEELQLNGVDEKLQLNGVDEELQLNGADEELQLNGADEKLQLNAADEKLQLNGVDEKLQLNGVDKELQLNGVDDEELQLNGVDNEELQPNRAGHSEITFALLLLTGAAVF